MFSSWYQSLVENYNRLPASTRYARMVAELFWIIALTVMMGALTGRSLIIANGKPGIGPVEVDSVQFWVAMAYVPMSFWIYLGNRKVITAALIIWTLDRARQFFITGDYSQVFWWLVVAIPAYLALRPNSSQGLEPLGKN